jgi:putative transposase
MDERLKFIARLLDGEKMAGLCREFGISRKTGYKILTRYNEIGLGGLTDRSRRPYRHANQLPVQIETRIVRLKEDKPSWGAPKIRERLSRLYPDVHLPAISTVPAVLDRQGLVKSARLTAKIDLVGRPLMRFLEAGAMSLPLNFAAAKQ